MPTLQWVEWFFLVMTFLMVGIPILFLILSFQQRHLDDPDCSKYTVFTADPNARSEEHPEPPLLCQLRYLKKRNWFDFSNTGWIWVTFGVAFIWLAIVVSAFLASRL
jgi:hypothetical protein